MRLVHVSDLHLPADLELRWSYLLSKRITGFANLVLRRWRLHSSVLAFQVAEAIRRLAPDHVVVTGDMTNLALRSELSAFRRWLQVLRLGPERVTVLAGNHDAYTRRAWRSGQMGEVLGAYWPCDPDERRPRVRELAPGVVLVGAESARPMPPFLAQGVLGAAQRSRISETLSRYRGWVRILALHHPIVEGLTRWQNVLLDASEVRALLTHHGAEAVLCGHLHKPYRLEVPGPGGPIPVLGLGSGSMDARTPKLRAQFRVLDISPYEEVSETLFVHDPETGAFRAWQE